MARIVHFDLTANDPDKLIPFYERVFKWKFSKWEGPFEYWLIETGPNEEPGINGGLGRRQGDERVVDTIDVEDIDAALAGIREQGGSVIADKAPIPGVGWFAQFKDPEGNLLGVMQSDPRAG